MTMTRRHSHRTNDLQWPTVAFRGYNDFRGYSGLQGLQWPTGATMAYRGYRGYNSLQGLHGLQWPTGATMGYRATELTLTVQYGHCLVTSLTQLMKPVSYTHLTLPTSDGV